MRMAEDEDVGGRDQEEGRRQQRTGVGDPKVDRVPDTRLLRLTPRGALELDLPLLVPLSWSIQVATAESRLWVLCTKQTLVSRSSEGWASKIKAPAAPFLGRILVLSRLAVRSPGEGSKPHDGMMFATEFNGREERA